MGAQVTAIVEDGTLIHGERDALVVPWWSFGKTVMAAACLALAADGRIDLDAPMDGGRYTLRRLLRHEAGLPDYGALPDYHAAVGAGAEPWSVDDLRRRLAGLTAPAGWSYSNVGYLRVREFLESTTGRPLGEAVAGLVCAPLGVTPPRLATEPGHLAGVEIGDAAGYHPGWVYHGLLVGALKDAALLLDRLLAGRLLPAPFLAQMLDATGVLPFADDLFEAPRYGLGLMLPSETPVPAAGHSGSGPGSSLAVYRFDRPEGPRTVAVFDTGGDRAAERAAFRLGR